MNLIKVTAEYANQRLDNFLITRFKNLPKSYIYRIIRKGEIRVNKGRVKQTYRLQDNDIIRTPPNIDEPAAKKITLNNNFAAKLKNRIIYEDKNLLIVDKPAGLASHGGTGINCGLIEALREIYPQEKHLELAHRLDRETSGCIIIAKKRSILKEIHELLREHKIKKTYIATVAGRWPKNLNKITAPLLKNTLQSGERMVKVDQDGKEALSTFEVINYDAQRNVSEIKINIQTGRTHQIRVHCQYAKHPIIGDTKYGNKKINTLMAKEFGLKRMCLKAVSIKFLLPSQDKMIDVRL